MNAFGVCTPNMEFTYVLTGWEGSAHDGRVLRNALTRPDGLRVPRGNLQLEEKNSPTQFIFRLEITLNFLFFFG